MSGTVTTDLAFFRGATGGSSAADSITDWTGVGLAVDTVAFVQGTGSIYSYQAGATTLRYWTFSCTSTNVSGKVIYFWFALGKVAWLNTKANGGLVLRIYDASGNYAGWYVAGSDTLPHNGFICHAVHMDTTPNETSGTVNKSAVTKVEIRANGSFPGKAYLWVDAIRYGTYLQIKGGTESSPATFEDIYNAETNVNNQWGILTKVNGIYFVQGQILIGSTTTGESTYFKDTNQVIVFKYALVPNDYYEINLLGNSGATTKIYFGTQVGGKGISGCIFRTAPGATPFKFTATNGYLTELGIYGCSFYDAYTISFPAYSSTRNVISTNFESCDEILPYTCTVKYCNIINPDLRGLRISSTLHHVSDCNFIGCPRAINVTINGTITFSNLIFTGCTYDIEKSSTGGDLTVQNTNGSNASTYIVTGDGNVTIQTAVSLVVRKVKTGNEPTDYVRCAIYRKSDMLELMNADASETDDLNPGYYKASTSTNLFGFTVIVRAREKGWLPFETEIYLTSSGLDVTAVWLRDPNYNA